MISLYLLQKSLAQITRCSIKWTSRKNFFLKFSIDSAKALAWYLVSEVCGFERNFLLSRNRIVIFFTKKKLTRIFFFRFFLTSSFSFRLNVPFFTCIIISGNFVRGFKMFFSHRLKAPIVPHSWWSMPRFYREKESFDQQCQSEASDIPVLLTLPHKRYGLLKLNDPLDRGQTRIWKIWTKFWKKWFVKGTFSFFDWASLSFPERREKGWEDHPSKVTFVQRLHSGKFETLKDGALKLWIVQD